MKKGWIVPPECCVIIEMEEGASLGYRKAVLLNEIDSDAKGDTLHGRFKEGGYG